MSEVVEIRYKRQGVETIYCGLAGRISPMDLSDALECLLAANSGEKLPGQVVWHAENLVGHFYAPDVDDEDHSFDDNVGAGIDEESAATALTYARAGNCGEALITLGRAVDECPDAVSAIDIIRRKLNLT
jgi:hypothetical protein